MTDELRPLWPHQERAISGLRHSIASGKRRPMVSSPTGAGKTRMAAHIIKGALAKGNRVIFVVPALSLIDQTVAAFEAEGITCIGVLQGDHPRTDPSQPVQVVSVQTLARRERPDAQLVIIDEAHQLHKSILRWMKEAGWAHVPFIGLSATPWSRGLGRYFDDLIASATTSDLIRDGFLSGFVAYAPSSPDLSGVSTVAGEFQQAELGDAMDKVAITGDIVETWLERGENQPTLAYCVNRKHAQHVTERFLEAGVAAEYLDGNTPREDRERIFDRFRAGETRILVNVGVLTTGIDLDVRCVVDAKPTKSEILFVQTIGRGLRRGPGKTKCIILDHAGNHLQLGRVTDIKHDCLDDGNDRQGSKKKQERTAPLPRLCHECKAVLSPQWTKCSECGAVREAKSAVVHHDGNLVEFGSGETSVFKATMAEKAAFHGELKWISRERRYNQGWAAHKFRERFGVWPNDWRVRTAEPQG